MADTAKRLVGPLLLNSTSTTLYTVPASTTTILRNIHVFNTNAGNLYSFNLAVGAANTVANCFYYQYPIAPNMAVDWSGFMVLAAGETLQALGSAATQMSIVVSGIEVT